jgi:hypothetical protein
MAPFKRYLGLRVAAVVSVVSLLVLGLPPPAFATPPMISSFSPTSGPTGCVVVITGTAFTDSLAAQTDLEFVAGATVVDAADFAVISATEIWATVPGLTAGTSYNIRITNPGGTSTSTGTFLSTTGAGECAPTINSFAPSCGDAGMTMAITGTNLLAPTLIGGEVRFNPYGASEVAMHTVPDASSPTSLSVIVPATAERGSIRVMTFGATGGTVFSTAFFTGALPRGPGRAFEERDTSSAEAPRRSRGGQRRRWVHRVRGGRSSQDPTAHRRGMETREENQH